MEQKQRYQKRLVGSPRSKYRSIRFTADVYRQIQELRDQDNCTFSVVVGEAVEWYMQLKPLLQEATEKSALLSGQPAVVVYLREYLRNLNANLDEALGEVGSIVESTEE